jgi:hypothetical protein
MNQNIREMAVVVICAFIAGFFGLWNALLEMEVLDLVNTKLPPEKQYPLLWGNHRYFELRREYKKMFPSGTLLQRAEVSGHGVAVFQDGLQFGCLRLRLSELTQIHVGFEVR